MDTLPHHNRTLNNNRKPLHKLRRRRKHNRFNWLRLPKHSRSRRLSNNTRQALQL